MYKNILWIEDCCDNNAGNYDLEEELNGIKPDDTEIIQNYFGDSCSDVNLIKEFLPAIEELNKNCFQYDLVIFDMNMEQGMEPDSFDKIEKSLGKNRVNIKEKVVNEREKFVKEEWDEFCANAGIYLYLYLLNKGYPNNRMVILTGNGKDSAEKRLADACICSDKSNLVKKTGGKIKGGSEWINQYYDDNYYLIRRMVFKACEYWKNELKDVNDEKIAFNKIYYKSNSGIAKGSFINMLERLELLFPVVKPNDPEMIYYQALQVLTMFHEESAKIQRLDKYPKVKKYHQSVRNFRNWSAHNKMQESKINAYIFIFLFCVTLRTYFVLINEKTKEQMNKETEFFGLYEEDVLNRLLSNCETLDYSKYERWYKADWKRHFEKVKDSSRKKWFGCNDINELLLESGNCDNKDSNKMKDRDCILNLLENHLIRNDDLKDDFRGDEAGYLYSIEYKWSCQNKMEYKYIKTLIDDRNQSFYYGLAIVLFLRVHSRWHPRRKEPQVRSICYRQLTAGCVRRKRLMFHFRNV